MGYWDSRLGKAQEEYYDKTVAELEARLAIHYRVATSEIKKEIEKVFYKVTLGKNPLQINDLYRNNALHKTLSNINTILLKLGAEQEKITELVLLEMYAKTSTLVADSLSFQVVAEEGAEEVIKAIWCSDNKSWSERLWKDRDKMVEVIEQGLFDSVSIGMPKDEIVKGMKSVLDSGFNNADRIVRTELTHVQNQAAANRYKEAGVTQYKYLASHDNRVSEKCKKLDGKTYDFDAAKIGVNFPPMHPNCRCTITPVI